jgi:hypothetical protein
MSSPSDPVTNLGKTQMSAGVVRAADIQLTDPA